MKHSLLPLLILSSIILVGFAPQRVEAQRISLSEGIATPLPAIVDRDDSLSLELNPAGLAHVDGRELMVVYADHPDNFNSGVGLLASTALGGGLGMGFGVQFIQPGIVDDTFRKYSLGFGFGENVSIGGTLNFFGSGDDRKIDDLLTFDLGVQFRLLRWLGLGLALRDANSPFLGDTAIAPQLVLGAALRSLEGRLLFEADMTLDQGRRVRPQFLVSAEPLKGLRVFGRLQSDSGPEGASMELTEFSLGLETNLEYFGASAAGTSIDGTPGFSGTLRFSDAAWRSVTNGGKRFFRVRISGDPPERPARDIFGDASGPSFLGTLRKLETMLNDPLVEGILLEVKGVSMGYGQAWELRDLLARFKAAGKPVVAYMHTPSQREFYLASIADHLMMGPSTTFNARGLGISQAFYRSALEKVGVKADFVRIAEFKSAPESFTQDGPSEPSALALNTFLDQIWDIQTMEMANGRGLGVEALKDLINTAPHNPGDALQAGLVDEVIYPDEIKETLKRLFGPGTLLSSRYERSEKRYEWGADPSIVVLHIDGNIVSGSSGANPLLGSSLTGARTIEKVIAWASKSKSVKAIVLRVDSPGGSATASDIMYRALERFAKKKPLIVSMGDVAASGGYYVAAPGKTIFCNPTTLTGSIGIYSGKFGLEGLYKMVGYNTLTNKRGDRADLYNMDTGWDESERAAILEQITYLYELFLSQVSKGRDIERDDLHKIAKGRIWSGVDAQRVGLCDQNGGLLAAIDQARQDAGLEEGGYQLKSLPAGDLLSPFIPDIGLDLGQVADLAGALGPQTATEATDAQIWQAYAPLRQLLSPLRPAIDLGVLFADGEPLTLLPFAIDY